MCYSAQIYAGTDRYVRVYGAVPNHHAYAALYRAQLEGAKIKTPKAMDEAFRNPSTSDEQLVWDLIEQVRAREVGELETTLFRQRKRLGDAERLLATKTTKAATESQRIAKDKIDWSLKKLADLRRTEPKPRDSRIFPGTYAPVMILEGGRRVIRPMRYQCRPAGKPTNYDTRYPGTFNSRRDNLEGFWKEQFGHTHGVMIVNAFYENVARHAAEGRALAPGELAENLVLEFRPEPQQDMLVACVWSHWTSPGQADLWSYAAITDEPPAEVAAAGHDRCIVPIKPEHIDAWLNPDHGNRQALYGILDDRDRPYYEHRLAA